MRPPTTLSRLSTLKNVFATGLFLFPSFAGAQSANPCDLNLDGQINVIDVQLATNMALGLSPCIATVVAPGVCDLTVVQRITNAALGQTCVTGLPSGHTVALNWTASTSTNVKGYYVYRAGTTGGPYTKLATSLAAGTSYTDTTVQAGQTYYYVATALDSNNQESPYSTEAKAVIPSP
jgi:hypothetical protein